MSHSYIDEDGSEVVVLTDRDFEGIPTHLWNVDVETFQEIVGKGYGLAFRHGMLDLLDRNGKIARRCASWRSARQAVGELGPALNRDGTPSRAWFGGCGKDGEE